MKLTGIEVCNFRSIKSTPVILNPWKKCNVLIGKNNTGKSNVIKALQIIKACFDNKNWALKLDRFDRPGRAENVELSFQLYFEATESQEDQWLVQVVGTEHFHFAFEEKIGQTSIRPVDHSFAQISNPNSANEILNKYANQRWNGHPGQKQITDTFLNMTQSIFTRNFISAIPEIHIIPEFRQIQHGETYTLDGKNLIFELARYQNPAFGKENDRKKFDRIQDLLRRLLHIDNALLQVTFDDPTIVIEANGTRLPLSSYGTGVHELVILLTAVLSVNDAICCIEEPEIHLHPTLQREFIQFLTTETSNEYLISTHSPTLINANQGMFPHLSQEIQVFHIYQSDGSTIGGPVIETAHSLNALSDLGVKASDILQTNCVIWVEGPSDRVYLNHWLKLVASDLIEGLHYSVMFYGGKLLSHLYAARETNDEKVPEELIEILKINQHAIVLIDSDKKSSRSHIGNTKRRVQAECESSESVCWITDGREVENYLPSGVIQRWGSSRAEKSIEISFMPYDRLEEQVEAAVKEARAKSINYAANKVEYSREIVQHFTEEDISPELKKNLEHVVNAIRNWNL